MAEILNAGYQTIRDFVEANWTHVELRDDVGATIVRLEIATDARCSWIHSPGDQTLKLQVVITGSDADITLPQTFGGAAMYNVASGGDTLAEDTFTEATLEAAEDQLKVVIDIEIPQVV